MIDLSGQVVTMTLNPAGTASWNNGVLTFTDNAGNVQHVSCPKPIQGANKVWSTCWPNPCEP